MNKCLVWLLLILSAVSLKATTLPNPTSYYVVLTWTAPTDGTDPVVGYYVFRSVNSGSTYAQLTENEVVPTTYSDYAMSYPAAYEYYVVSVDAQNNMSVPSNILTVSIPLVPYSPVLGTVTNN